MALNIENASGVSHEISDFSITLAIGEIIDLATRIDPLEIVQSANGGQLETDITSGDISVKDPIDGTTSLSVADGLAAARQINESNWRLGTGARIGDISDVDLSGQGDTFVLQHDTGSGNYIAVSPSTLAADMAIGDLSDVDVTGIATDDLLQWNGSSFVVVDPSVIGGGASFQLEWRFSTSIVAADPGNTNFRYDNATLASVTNIYFDDVATGGFDVGTIFSTLGTGDKIYIQQNSDATKAALFTLSGSPTDNTGWWTVPVTVDASGTLHDNNAKCAAVLFQSGSGGSGNAFGTITGGDGGSAVAIGTDTITVNGTGINITATDGAAGLDTLDLLLDVSDLTLGVGAIAATDEVAVNDISAGGTRRFTMQDLIDDLNISITTVNFNYGMFELLGNRAGDFSVDADGASDDITFTGGIGILLTGDQTGGDIEWEFTRLGMADTAVVSGDTVPFFDASNLNEPEYRSWANIITDLGILTTGLQNVVEDTTPQLGGNLDVNGFEITAAGTDAIILRATGTSDVELHSADDIQLFATSHIEFTGTTIRVDGTIVSAPIGSNNDLTLTPDGTGNLVLDGVNWPQADGSSGQILETDGAGQLSFVDPTFADDVFRITGSVDATKLLAFEVDGLTTLTTRTITMPDQDIDLTPGTGSFATEAEGNLAATALQNVVEDTTPQLGGNLDVNGFEITSAGNLQLRTTGTGNRDIQLDSIDDIQLVAVDDVEITATDIRIDGPIRSFPVGSNNDLSLTPDGTGNLVLDGLNWPQADGSPGQILETDGFGQLSFVTPGSGPTFADDVFRITGSVDATKLLAFEVDGLTTLTTRTITMPDQNIDLTPSSGTFAASSTTITAGAGLTGGGDLSANRTLDVVGGEGITANADDIELDYTVATVTAVAGDFIQISDASNAGAVRKVDASDFLSGGGAPTTAQYVTMALDATLSAERVLTGGSGITLTDGGANGNATLDLDINSLAVATIAAGDFVPFWDITATATNKKITFANFEGTLNHDNLAGFVADEHVAHTSVTLTAGVGLTGGGDISASRTFDLDITGLTADTIAAADEVAFFDTSGVDHNKITFANFEGTLNHDNLAGFVADEHVAHSSVTLTAGSGLAGGGDITASRTFDLDINSLATETTIAAGDFVPFWDITATATNKKLTFANFEGILNHDSLAGFVADEHVAHTSVTLTAGVGLTGGGDISASRTFDLDITGLTADTIAAADELAFFDASGVDHNKITFANFEGTLNHDNLAGFVADEHVAHAGVVLTAGTGLTGGGDISASRTFNVIGGEGITANADDIELDYTVATVTAVAGDFIQISDASAAGAVRKVDVTDFINGSDTLGAVQARRTTAYTLTTAFVDITFDTTDEETDAAVVEHNNTNTDDIDIKEAGTYLIRYESDTETAAAANNTNIQMEGRVRLNDTSVLPGSEAMCASFEDNSVAGSEGPQHLSNAFIATLAASDKVTLQLNKVEISGTSTYTAERISFQVIKLEGVRGATGATGATGSGSNITLEDEDVAVTNTPHSTLNFTGAGVTVTDAGSGQADITIPGGSISAVQARRTTTFTPTAAWQDVTLDATDLENDAASVEHNNTNTDRIDLIAAGLYRISARADFDSPSAGGMHAEAQLRVRVNDTSVVNGSETHQSIFNDSSIEGNTVTMSFSSECLYQATANDFITMQIQHVVIAGSPDETTRAGGVVLIATRLGD